MDYEFSIINEEEETYRIFDVGDERVIGVVKSEPFMIRFKNNTSSKVQVRLSVDGTDILTGDLASTKPTGKMWLVDAHKTLELKAWPETTNGGARFVFTSEKQSVAVNTHGNRDGIGLIAAAVYVEKPNSYRYFVSGFNSFTMMPKFGSSSYKTRSIGSNNDDFQLFDSSVAVGAGEHVEQKISETAGLYQPVLNDILQIRYMPWQKLQKLVKTAKTSNAFPGDKSKKLINLSNVPKVPKARTKKSKQEVQRFL